MDAKVRNWAFRWLGHSRLVPIKDCVHYCAFRYGCGDINPYENYAVALVRGEPLAEARKRLVEFLLHYRPRNFGEALGVTLSRFHGLWQYPWSRGKIPLNEGRPGWKDDPDDFPDIITHFSERGILRFRIEEEFLWAERIFYSIRRHGFDPKRSTRYIEARELTAANGQKRYLILDGNHRVSALAALGEKMVAVRCIRLMSVRETAMPQWPQVKKGAYSPEDALKVFRAYFVGNLKPRTTPVPAVVLATNEPHVAMGKIESAPAESPVNDISSEPDRSASLAGRPGNRVRRAAGFMARAILPSRLSQVIRRRLYNVRWEGDYASWAEAEARSTGYDAPAILEKVYAAAMEVRAGRALFERDGVTFTRAAPTWPALEWVAQRARRRDGGLQILDFGGSLGSLYFQYKPVWDAISKVEWRVVEQPLFVATGRRELRDGRLDFHETIEQAEAAGPADILLLSGVLQCLDEPHDRLELMLAKQFPVIILDRVPIIDRGFDRLTVQYVPASINKGSYPCWHFDREKLLRQFKPHYTLRLEFPGLDGEHDGATHRGFIFEYADRP